MEYIRPINGVYWGYNPFTNHLLTFWDIQVFICYLYTTPKRKQSQKTEMVGYSNYLFPDGYSCTLQGRITYPTEESRRVPGNCLSSILGGARLKSTLQKRWPFFH